jgi:hypothetical protein
LFFEPPDLDKQSLSFLLFAFRLKFEAVQALFGLGFFLSEHVIQFCHVLELLNLLVFEHLFSLGPLLLTSSGDLCKQGLDLEVLDH